MHEGTATSRDDIKDGERVNNEAEFLVGQEGVKQDEAHDGHQHRVHPPVQQTKRNKYDGGTKSTRKSRIEVPEKRGGLLRGDGQGNTGGAF